MEVTISTRIYTVSKSLYKEELPVASLIQCHMMDSQPIENQSILSSTCFRLFQFYFQHAQTPTPILRLLDIISFSVASSNSYFLIANFQNCISRFVATELATDIVINVGDVKFYLHKVWTVLFIVKVLFVKQFIYSTQVYI